MTYCAQCRIGTIDAQGLCVLCGAPDHPPTRRGRLAERTGSLLSTLLSPLVLGVAGAVAVLVLFAIVSQPGGRGSIPNLAGRLGRFGALDPAALAGLARHAPGQAAAQFLWPALMQALLFAILLAGLFWLLSRWRRTPPHPLTGRRP